MTQNRPSGLPKPMHLRASGGALCLARPEPGRPLPYTTSSPALVTCPECERRIRERAALRDTSLAQSMVTTELAGYPLRFVRLNAGVWRVYRYDSRAKFWEPERIISTPKRLQDAKELVEAFRAAERLDREKLEPELCEELLSMPRDDREQRMLATIRNATRRAK